MKRYKALTKKDIYDALNRLRDAFLAAKDGNDVNTIINGLLTSEERIRIGRRIIISEYIKDSYTHDEIAKYLKVGKNTINSVYKNLISYPDCFELIHKRKVKVENEYKDNKYSQVGGSKLFYKKRVYSGIKRIDVKR